MNLNLNDCSKSKFLRHLYNIATHISTQLENFNMAQVTKKSALTNMHGVRQYLLYDIQTRQVTGRLNNICYHAADGKLHSL
jgi:hypothetical protein